MKSPPHSKNYETAPSAIKVNVREKLVLHSPDVTGCALPFMALWTLLVLGMAIYCPLSPGCVPKDSPWWVVPVIYGMGLIGMIAMMGMIRSNKTMTFDFIHKHLLRWYYPVGGKRFITETITFREFRKISVEFEKARFSDDSDTWWVILHLKNGQTLMILKALQEETAFKVVNRLIQELKLELDDPQALFPLSKMTVTDTSAGQKPGREIRIQENSQEIQLEHRPRRFASLPVFVGIFTFAWCCMVIFFFVAMFRDMFNSKNGIDFSHVIGSGVGLLIFGGAALFLTLLTLWLLFGTIVLKMNRDRLVREERMWGKTLHRKSIAAKTILKIDIPEDESKHACLRIYASDGDTIMTFADGLKKEELIWIQQELQKRL